MSWLGDVWDSFTGQTAADAARAGQQGASQASLQGMREQMGWIDDRTAEGARLAYGRLRGADIAARNLEGERRGELDAYGRQLQGGMDQFERARAAQIGTATGYGLQGIGALQGGMGNLQDYFGAGQAGIQSLAGLAGGVGPTDITQDPGYQFRLQEGLGAIQSAGSAAGLSQSGRQQKELMGYASGLASQEYGAADARNMQRAALQSQVGGQLSQLGLGGVGLAGQNLMQQANLYGNLPTMAAQGASLALDPRTNMMSPTGAWQDRGGLIGNTMAAQNAMYGGSIGMGANAIAQNTQAQSAIQQNLGDIGAAQGAAPFQNLMSIGTMASGFFG